MTSTASTPIGDLDHPRDVLAFARSRQQAADTAHTELFLAAATWADQHPPESIVDAATWIEAAGDTGLPLAGEGAPLVAEFDLADALDLEDAVSREAEALKAAGSTESLDVRRSQALGQISRDQLALDLQAADDETTLSRPRKQ